MFRVWNIGHFRRISSKLVSRDIQLQHVACFSSCSSNPRQQQLLPPHKIVTTPVRGKVFSSIISKAKAQKAENERKAQELYGKLVYEGPNKRQITSSKFFSIFAATAVVGMQAAIIIRLTILPEEVMANAFFMLAGTCVLSTILMALPIYLNRLLQRAVLRMYYDDKSQTFSAVAYGTLMDEKVLQFKADEVVDPGNAAPMTTALIGKHPILFDTSRKSFLDSNAYEVLMCTGMKKSIPELMFDEVKLLKEEKERKRVEDEQRKAKEEKTKEENAQKITE